MDNDVEAQVVLRVPPDVAQRIRDILADAANGDANGHTGVSFQFDGNGRKGTVTVPDVGTFKATLVDLPCILESHKTFDNLNFYKSADIGQMIVVGEEHYSAEYDAAEDAYAYPSGITHPTKNIREQRHEVAQFSKDEVRNGEQKLQRILKGAPIESHVVHEESYYSEEELEIDEEEWNRLQQQQQERQQQQSSQSREMSGLREDTPLLSPSASPLDSSSGLRDGSPAFSPEAMSDVDEMEDDDGNADGDVQMHGGLLLQQQNTVPGVTLQAFSASTASAPILPAASSSATSSSVAGAPAPAVAPAAALPTAEVTKINDTSAQLQALNQEVAELETALETITNKIHRKKKTGELDAKKAARDALQQELERLRGSVHPES